VGSPAVARTASASRRGLGELPLIVLTAGRIAWSPEFTSAEIEAMTGLWARFHDEHARLSNRGVCRDAPDSGHAIHIERPEVVIEAIREVIASARA
jgi:hypothetical protein